MKLRRWQRSERGGIFVNLIVLLCFAVLCFGLYLVRHPLMRSAVRQAAPIKRRRRAHEALAEALSDDPDRRVWHRAALISGPHEDVAAELEDAGRRARRRGAISVAGTALRRAAELSALLRAPLSVSGLSAEQRDRWIGR